MKLAISLFDKFLSDRKLEFRAIIIGGAALNLMGVISRETRDVDFLDPEIPAEIKKAQKGFRS